VNKNVFEREAIQHGRRKGNWQDIFYFIFGPLWIFTSFCHSHSQDNHEIKNVVRERKGGKNMKKKIVGIGICMLIIIAVFVPVSGTINKREIFDDRQTMQFVPGEFIVKLKKDTTFSKSSLIALNEKHKVYAFEKIFPNADNTILDTIYLLHVPIGYDILSIVHEYLSYSDIVYAEPNGIGFLCNIPNDTNFSKQWSLHNTGQTYYGTLHGTPDADIDAPEAWDIETGSPDVVIAIIDTGVDYTHPDLAANIWNNTDEIPGNGIDDDHNGYLDDIRGWDLCDNNSDPKDIWGHGTECAGVAAASTNNGIGIAGVGGKCKIMPLKICNETGWWTWDDAAEGIKYAADNGADIISMSFGDYTAPNITRDVVNYAYGKGVFLCAAAGNDNANIKLYPAAYENVTAVGATAHNDHRASFSTYGEWVDIAAPGQYIYSTMPTYHVMMNDYGLNQNYDFNSGTSFSSPMTAGVAALLLSKDPSLTPDQVKALLCENVDPYNSTQYIGTGRLNAQKALTALQLKDGVKIKGDLGVKLIITNDGTSDVINVTWQIHVEGGVIGMINKTKNGTINIIPAGKSKTVSTGVLLGLGKFNISAKVMSIEMSGNGTQLFIFSMVKK
jgi:subtilisin family serine protease